MKYNFCYKEIGKLKNETLSELREYALAAQYKKNAGHFHKEILKTYPIQLDDPIIELVKNELNSLVDKTLLKKAMINILPPSMHIPEHSDVGPKSFNTDDLTIHKIHIPIITNTYCCHTWNGDTLAGDVCAKHMEEGKIYLFNNVTLHGATNASPTDSRYHLIMRYCAEAINVS